MTQRGTGMSLCERLDLRACNLPSRPGRRLYSVVVAILLLVSMQPLAGAAAPSRPDAQATRIAGAVTIYRDSYGVPHIYGPTDASCVFGFAYAQAEDNLRQVEDNFISALGRMAEVEGEKALNDDLLARALDFASLAKAEYDRAPANMRKLYEA